MKINEGLAKITIANGVFFNPHMKICRDISSLYAGAVESKLSICDAFSASGIRGIRYMLENDNVEKITLVDISRDALPVARGNLKANKISNRKGKAVCKDIRKFLYGRDLKFNFVEIDPFGSPLPVLADACRFGDMKGKRYLSITATDTAVFCGAHAKACIKNYGAKPLDNEFCHETALRLLIGRVAREAAMNNWATSVEFSMSKRHYLKTMVRLEQGAAGAVESSKKSLYFISFCPKCLWRQIGKFREKKCPKCSANVDWAGPLWGGEWAGTDVVGKMARLHKEREYLESKVEGLLDKIKNECKGPPLYYDLHELAGNRKHEIPKMDVLVGKLEELGFFASRTHFNPHAIRTDAEADDIADLMH